MDNVFTLQPGRDQGTFDSRIAEEFARQGLEYRAKRGSWGKPVWLGCWSDAIRKMFAGLSGSIVGLQASSEVSIVLGHTVHRP